MIERRSIKKNKRKTLIAAIVMAVIMVTAIGSTVAYLVNSSEPVDNTFALAKVGCKIDETVENGIKSVVTVKNTGEAPVYIRVAVVANKVDESDPDSIIGPADVSANLCGTDWVKNGDFYYYTKAVPAGSSTENLLKSGISLEDIQVTILTEAIQAKPIEAAYNAWGVAPASLSPAN